MISIGEFIPSDTDGIVTLVLHCQNDGTRPPVRAEDQPDILHIGAAYAGGGGAFWVAKDRGKVVGTIGLMNAGNGLGILKKFFVGEAYRGKPHFLGRRLYAVFLEFARAHGFRRICLDTPRNTTRAHRFYEKAGFRQVDKADYPLIYECLYDENDFFCLDL